MLDRPGNDARDELVRLLDHYEGAYRAHLELTYKYFSFYLTIMVAVLGATLAAVAQPGPTEKAILLAPTAACLLAVLCRSVVLVFYRRHIEAWLTTENILTTLGRSVSHYAEFNDVHDFYYGRERGQGPDDWPLIVRWERPRTANELRDERSVEDLMRYFAWRSDVMRVVMLTLAGLFVASLLIALFILLEDG